MSATVATASITSEKRRGRRDQRGGIEARRRYRSPRRRPDSGHGVVLSGSSNIDTASITGKSVPVDVNVGSEVFNGSINLEGLLKIRVMHVGGETTLGRVIALMQEAENIKPAVTRLLERCAGGYMALVLLLTTSLWFLTGSSYAALAVLTAPAVMANAGRLLKFQDNVFSVPA